MGKHWNGESMRFWAAGRWAASPPRTPASRSPSSYRSDPSGTSARSYRPNVIGTPHDPHQIGPGAEWLDISAYATPANCYFRQCRRRHRPRSRHGPHGYLARQAVPRYREEVFRAAWRSLQPDQHADLPEPGVAVDCFARCSARFAVPKASAICKSSPSSTSNRSDPSSLDG